MNNNTFYLLVHDHKHGYDHSLHRTYEQAKTYGISLMREIAGEIWGEDVSVYSDGDLWSGWNGLSGETEYFSIEEITLED